ncbi:hypothetical protein GCM10028783_39460 [Modestobacter muralis]
MTEDWADQDPDVLSERTRARITPESVALMHDGGGDRLGTVEAVDRMIPELRAQGWRLGQPPSAADRAPRSRRGVTPPAAGYPGCRPERSRRAEDDEGRRRGARGAAEHPAAF